MLIVQRPQIRYEPVEGSETTVGRFVVEPLEPGLGHTLGNSLRRMLLSSIPGAAVTSVTFRAALHEFTTIPGVKEDVTDIILNLKDVILTSASDETVTLTLNATGPAEVTAGDIRLSSDVEIVNPELHIASVNDKGRLEFECTVDRGRGYVGADANKRPNQPIGTIPVDAIFGPVRKVTYEVGQTRVEQATNFDSLTLTVTTDGSLTPEEAVSSAGKTLGGLVELFAEVGEGQGLEIGELVTEAQLPPELEMSIEELNLSERPRNCLKRAQIDTVGELVEKSEDDLLAITNFGQKSLDEVKVKLDELGLTLKGGTASVSAESEA
ncbi:MAG: DNA-directed RNA polymerase subunit alpha [Acidimicrobiia bacterium]